MNAVVPQPTHTVDQRGALRSAIAARAIARSAVEQAALGLTQAQTTAYVRRASAERAAHAENAAAIDDAAHTAQMRRDADAAAAAADRQVSTARAVHARAIGDSATADAAVQDAAFAVLRAEADEQFARVIALENRAVQIRTQLLGTIAVAPKLLDERRQYNVAVRQRWSCDGSIVPVPLIGVRAGESLDELASRTRVAEQAGAARARIAALITRGARN